MLEKNCSEPFMASDDANVRPPSTPHRIRIPSAEDIFKKDHKKCLSVTDKRIHSDAKFDTTTLSDKAIKTSGKRGRKPLNRLIADQKVTNSNHKVTEYFQARRSVRKCKKAVLEELQRELENKVLQRIEDGLQVKNFVGKGRGVVTTRPFTKGEFVVEYSGELIDQAIAKKREATYSRDQSAGCYMYYFIHRNQHYCVDATVETEKLGRLVNHSRNGNLVTKIVEVGSEPHLVLIAKEDIDAGVEITYDYGDRSRESIRNYPWLAL